MTVAEITSQIGDIQARLAALAASVTPSTDDGAGFASALSGATAASGAASGSSTTGASGVTGNDVVNAALQYRGVPYVLGGESRSGIDCSGLVQAAFKDVGVSVPRLVHQQETIGEKVDSLKDAKPGDLIVLNGGDHIAIYAGNDTVIHAPYPGRTVSVQKAWFGDADITAIRRVVPASDDDSGAASAIQADAAGSASPGTTAATTATTASTASASTTASAAALLAMYGGQSSDDGTSSLGGTTSGTGALASMLTGYGTGTGGSSSTAQQLLAARAALLGSGG